MEADPFLHPHTQRLCEAPLTATQRYELRRLFGEELYGEDIPSRRKPLTTTDLYFEYEAPAVSAGDLFNDKREWTVVDTVFGRRYLALADHKGGFVLLSLLPGVLDVLVEFDRPVPTDDMPTRRYDEMRGNPVPSRNRLQYITFQLIAASLVAESEQRQA